MKVGGGLYCPDRTDLVSLPGRGATCPPAGREQGSVTVDVKRTRKVARGVAPRRVASAANHAQRRGAVSLVLAFVLTALLSIPAVALAGVQDHAAPGLTPRGTTINVFDYWIDGQNESDNSNPYNYQNLGINAGEVLKFGKNMGSGSVDDPLNASTVNEWTQSTEPRQDIVADELGSDGYPVLAWSFGGDSLSYLFDPTEKHDGKESFSNVGGLLRVDEVGYYYYDCHDNFAQFDETGNTFFLYPNWAVNAGGASGNGQFFPFDSGNEVFIERGGNLTQNSVTSEDEGLNHYFGLTMTTNFVQQFGGHTDEMESQPVTYNFSGDDDVWIFIDGVLVGDLGGIHNTSSIQIDFSTGEVVVYDDKDSDNVFDGGETYYQKTTLRALFEAADRDVRNFEDGTLPDGSYHSLDFFYLERGNVDSNMSLKYNLVTIPETDITKVDQEGNFVAGATFQVTDSDTGDEICTAVTENDGTVVLLDENDYPITIDELYAERHNNLTFTETETPMGYRGVESIELYIQHYGADQTANKEETNVLLSSDPWTTGAYAQSKVTVTAANEVLVDDRPLSDLQKQSGMMFVVVEKLVDGEWHPVTGDALNGWTVSSSTESNMQAVIDAGRSTNAVFVIASSGAYQAEVENLPGRVQDYVFFKSETGEYRGRYFYTSASNWDDADDTNTSEIQNANEFDRQFSARVYISNIVNRVLVQKVDEAGNAVNGATMGLYSNDQVTVDRDTGVATLNADAQPSQTAVTQTLSKVGGDSIDLNGAAIFTMLTPDTYWVGEVSAPAGYVPSKSLAKVIVDGTGVYADAGTPDDGVSVTRGIGRVVRSMIQFAVDDDIDASLHDVVATPMTGTSVGDWASIEGVDPLHLSYADDEDAVLDYEASEGSEQPLKVETGIPYLMVQQCNETTAGENTHGTPPRQDLENTDLTNLFTGVTIVHIENERTASLEVTKELEKDAALVGPSATTSYQIKFSFTFPTGTNVNELPLTARVFNAEGGAVGEEFAFTVDQQGGLPFGNTYTRTQGLEAGQTIKLYGLPNGTTYTITETEQDALPDGVTLKSITNANNEMNEGDDAEATGTVEATTAGAQADHVTVTNQYTAKPTHLGDTQSQFKAEKTLDGREWVTGEQIDFVLSTAVGDTVTPMPQDATTVGGGDEAYRTSRVTRSENGKFTFADITYDKAGPYTYTITEDAASHRIADGTEEQNAAIKAGMTYSSAKYEVTVDVTDVPDGQETGNGQLRVASVTYRQVAPESGDATIASFVNEFDAAATTGQLYAFKTYKDTTAGNPAKEGQFSTTLRPTGDDAATSPMPAGAEGEGAGRTITTPFSDDGSALSAAFGEMSFQYAGAEQTYYYEVSENLPKGATADNNYTVGGMTYDPTVYTVRVTVSAAQSSMAATTQLTYAIAQSAYEDITQDTVWTSFSPSATRDENQPLFTNIYSPGSSTYDPEGEHGVQVTKQVFGNVDGLSPEGYEFTMTVVNAATNDATGIESGTPQTKTSSASGAVDFDDVKFSQVGDYTVTVSETSGTDEHTTYDGHQLVYTVRVYDAGNGQLVAEAVENTVSKGESIFTNLSYNEEDAKHVFDGQTVIDGKTVGVGETLTYSIDWVNTVQDDSGSPAAATVTVVDTLPQGVTLVEESYGEGAYDAEAGTIKWTIEAAPAQVGTVSFQVTVDPAAAGTTIENSATVNGVDTNTVTNPVPGKEETSRPGEIGEGTVLTYQISFTNTDGAGATAEVVDSLTKGQDYIEGSAVVNGQEVEPTVAGDAANGQTLTWNLADLAANERVTIVFSVTLTRDAGTSVDNTATVNGHKTNTTTTPYPTDNKKDVFQADDPTTSVNGKLVGVGDELTYTIDWAADEDGTLTVTDVIPAGTALVEGSISEGGVLSDDGTTITWALGEKNAGDKGTVSFNVTVTNDAVDHDPITNSASIQVGENDPKVVTATTDIPKKTVEDATPDTGIQVGDRLDYEIEWANDSGETATVTVKDVLPAGLTYVEHSASNNGVYEPETHTITWILEDQPNGAKGTVSFSAIVNEGALVTKDPLTNTATINVGDNEYTTNTTNDDDKPATANLTISKAVDAAEGESTDYDKSFSFTVTLKDAGNNPLQGSYLCSIDNETSRVDFEDGVVTIPLKHGQSATIFGLPEGARYEVAEESYADEGYFAGLTEDSDDWSDTIDADGAIVNVKNTYDPKSGKLEIVGNKRLTDADGNAVTSPSLDEIAGKFEFTIEAVDGAPLPDAQTATNNVDGTIRFGPVVYSVEDVLGVSDEPVENSGEGAIDEGGVTDDGVSDSWDVLGGNTGADAVTGDAAIVDETAANPETGANDVESVELSSAVQPRTNSRTFTYKVTEKPDTYEGITGDETVWTVEVTVTVGDNGFVTAEVTSVTAEPERTPDEGSDFTFVNTVEGSATTGDLGSGALQVTKKVDGAAALEEFSFKLTPVTDYGDAVGGLEEDGSLTATTSGLKGNVGTQTVNFDKLTFTEPGTYRFNVIETNADPSDTAWTYDNDNARQIVVTVSGDADGDGKLEISTMLEDVDTNNPTFTNVYEEPYVPPIEPDDPDETDPSKPDLDVDKTLTGRDMVAGEFSFKITATGSNADHVSPKTLTGTNDASGNVSFSGDGFKFDEAGEYTFTVSEVLPQDDDPETPGVQHNGVTYDETTYTITAKVTKGTGNKLVATWDLGSAAGGVTFANTYEPDETASVSLGATKVLNGRDLVAGEFTFELVDGQGNVVATATNAADGSVVFSPIEFTEAGTYTYLIREVAGSLANVTYDTATHTATVTVTDNGDGTLTATVLYDGSGTLPVFTNTYKVPEEPGEPDKPGKPTEPSKPEEPQKPATPDTGDHTNAAAPVALALSGVALVAGAYVLRVRRNR